jgi:hypothetical protein
MRHATYMSRARVILLLTALLLLGFPAPARPEDPPEAQASLKGIPAVKVIVGTVNPEAVEDGLTEDQLQTAVERRLREAGIRVTSSLEEAGSSYLYLCVSTVKHHTGLYTFNIELAFKQVVLLERNRQIRLFSTTWRASDQLGFVGAYKLHEVRGAVVDKVDNFIYAYLSQNPKS